MKRLLLVLFALGCGATSADKAEETTVAKDQRHQTEAPPGSSNDLYRYQLIQSFDNMDSTQRAFEEAQHAEGSASRTSKRVSYPPRFPAKKQPKKNGPAVEASKQ
jgi:hypothetical protein